MINKGILIYESCVGCVINFGSIDVLFCVEYCFGGVEYLVSKILFVVILY